MTTATSPRPVPRKPQRNKTPVVSFHRLIPTARLPQRADRSAAGSLPTRAFRYCEPATSASGYGYYIFPPVSFSLQWDGRDVMWTWDGAGAWLPLKSAQFPNFRDLFEQVAPEEIRDYAPPFLGALQEPGLIQLWTGIVARTAPGWSLLVRAPANVPRSGTYELFEGIIETDRWFGPLFVNLKLTRPNVPIAFDANYPFLQVQPVHRSVYGEALDDFDIVEGIEDLQASDWADFHRTVSKPMQEPHRPRGEYAVQTRKRRQGEEAPTNS